MLATPPPGYNPNSINNQQVSPYNTPGQQGNTAMGYLQNPYRSSYATPSSYAFPSSVPAPNAYYGGHANPMVKALSGGGI